MVATHIDESKVLRRTVPIELRDINDAARTVELAFSSEAEVERSFGIEILDHDPASVNMDRLRTGAPLLVNHNPDDQVGVVENAMIAADRKGRATVRFGASARAKEIFQDVRDGIRRLVSVGYWPEEKKSEKRESGPEAYRVTRWTPLEISIVSIPADISVGVGRSNILPTTSMAETTPLPSVTFPPAAPPAPSINIEEIRAEVAKGERARIAEIRAVAAKFETRVQNIHEIAEKAISTGTDHKEFLREVFMALPNVTEIKNPNPYLGVPERDLKRYSFVRAINRASEGKLDGLERELSDEHAAKMKRQPGSFWVPQDVLEFTGLGPQRSQRDLLKGTATLGGHLVATELLASSFIDLLRNRMVIARLGATMLDGLQGNIAIPRQTSGATHFWVTETEASTESDATFDQVTLSPKGLTAVSDYSKLLLIQSSIAIENFVRTDLAKTLALAQDRAALHGSGSAGQPTGIINVSGIGDVAGGTNGAAPVWGNIVDLETEVANDNADIGSIAYLSNTRIRGKLKKTERTTATNGQFIWTDGTPTNSGIGALNGYSSYVSNQVANNLTKGTSTTVCSAIFFGNWSDLLIGSWAGLDILVDPYTQAINRVYRILASLYTDLAVRHPESFSAMKDALTT